MSEDTPDPVQEAYNAYVLHIAPNEGPKCLSCSTAQSPYSGCAEGRRVWGIYRLAKIDRSTTTAP